MTKKQKQHQTIVPGNALAVNVVGTAREDLAFALKRKQLIAAKFIQKVRDKHSI